MKRYAAAMAIRAAVLSDIPQIVAIEQIPEYRNYIGAWTAEEHARVLSDPDAAYLVSIAGENEVHGFAILQGLQSEHHSIHLKRLAVRTPNQGIGRALLDYVLERAFRQLGAHRFWLDVFETNVRAIRVYEAYGFRNDGLLRDAILLDGEYHTLVFMSLLEPEYTSKQQRDEIPVTLKTQS